MAIIGMFFQDGLTGSAWGDWALYTASPLRAFENELGVQAPVGFWDPVGYTKDGRRELQAAPRDRDQARAREHVGVHGLHDSGDHWQASRLPLPFHEDSVRGHPERPRSFVQGARRRLGANLRLLRVLRALPGPDC